MFTKEHYKAIASIIKSSSSSHSKDLISKGTLITKLINYFEEDNSKFDKDKFIKTCGDI